MKTTNEIMSEVFDAELYEDDDVRACTLYKVKVSDIQKGMVEYAKEVLQDFIENETGENGICRIVVACISTDQDKLDKFKNQLK